MRLVLAAIVSFFTVLPGVSFFLSALKGVVSETTLLVLVGPLFLAVIFLAYLLFNKQGQHWPYPTLEQLEKQCLVEATDFQAKRCFQIQEFEDEGIHYYLELNDGSVLL